jgi:hypothetical protein
MIEPKREFGNYFWERLIIALIGEQFPVDVVCAVISVRFQATIISLWNRTGSSTQIRHEIYCGPGVTSGQQTRVGVGRLLVPERGFIPSRRQRAIRSSDEEAG